VAAQVGQPYPYGGAASVQAKWLLNARNVSGADKKLTGQRIIHAVDEYRIFLQQSRAARGF